MNIIYEGQLVQNIFVISQMHGNVFIFLRENGRTEKIIRDQIVPK